VPLLWTTDQALDRGVMLEPSPLTGKDNEDRRAQILYGAVVTCTLDLEPGSWIITLAKPHQTMGEGCLALLMTKVCLSQNA